MLYATVIGSRKIPIDFWRDLATITYHLFKLGFCVRTGGATGSDEAALQAWIKYKQDHPDSDTLLEVWIPWSYFNLYQRYDKDVFHLQTDDMYYQSLGMLERTKVCTYQSKLKGSVLRLFARNVSQIFGQGESSEFVIYYAPEKNKVVSGGTRIAVDLARYYSTPTYNIGIPEEREALMVRLKRLTTSLSQEVI